MFMFAVDASDPAPVDEALVSQLACLCSEKSGPQLQAMLTFLYLYTAIFHTEHQPWYT